MIEVRKFEWDKQLISTERYRTFFSNNFSDLDTFAPVLKRREICRDWDAYHCGSNPVNGDDFFVRSYLTAYEYSNTLPSILYGRPDSIYEFGAIQVYRSSSNPNVTEDLNYLPPRLTKLKYYVDQGKWIIKRKEEEIFESHYQQYYPPSPPFYDGKSMGKIDRTFDTTTGNLLSIERFKVKTSYQYHTDGNIHTITDPENNVTYLRNYYRGIPTQEEHPAALPSMLTPPTNLPTYAKIFINRKVNSAGTITAEQNGRGFWTYYNYDKLNRITEIGTAQTNTPPAAFTDTPHYDIFVSYDEDFGTKEVLKRRSHSNIDISTSCINFDNNSCIDNNIYHQEITRDGFGRPLCINREGIITKIQYDALGRKIRESYPRTGTCSTQGAGTDFEYDVLNRIKKITHADGTSKAYVYEGKNEVLVSDEKGILDQLNYASFGNPDVKYLIRTTLTASGISYRHQMRIKYNALGYPVRVEQRNNIAPYNRVTRTYEYYPSYYLKRIIEPERTVSFCRYRTGEIQHRIVNAPSGGGSSVSCNHTFGSGSVSFNGHFTSYEYDERNRLAWVNVQSEPLSPLAGEDSDIEIYYDQNDNVVLNSNNISERQYTYDANDNLTNEVVVVKARVVDPDTGETTIAPFSIYTRYIYDGLDNLKILQYPGVADVLEVEVHYSPNDLGWPTTALTTSPTDWGSINQKFVHDIQYYPNGTFKHLQFANGRRLNFELQNRQWVEKISSSDNLFSYTYGYDGVGNTTSIIDGVDDYRSFTNITYDGANRLTGATTHSGLDTFTYEYDAVGNIIGRTESSADYIYNYNANNQLKSIDETIFNPLTSTTTTDRIYDFSYDNYGNVTYDGVHEYSYNHQGQLRAVDEGGNNENTPDDDDVSDFSYAYDPENNRIERTQLNRMGPEDDLRYYSIYNKAGQLLTEINSVPDDGVIGSVRIRDYIYVGNRLIGQITDRPEPSDDGGSSGGLLGRAPLPACSDLTFEPSGNVSHFQVFDSSALVYEGYSPDFAELTPAGTAPADFLIYLCNGPVCSTSAVACSATSAGSSASTIYFSTQGNSTIPSVASPYDNADIYRWDGSGFGREFDAVDDLGLSSLDKVDGYTNSATEGLCVSFETTTTVPGLSNAVDYTDVVCQANGSWSVFFDGSAQGLGTTSAYNLDAISIVNGVLYFSTKGSSSMTIPGVAAPYHTADIYSWDNGTFTRVFDANAAGLASNADMDGLAFIDNDTFYASFSRNDSYGGTSLPGGVVALDEDVVKYDQGNWTVYFEGVAEGFDANNDGQDINALDFVAGSAGGHLAEITAPTPGSTLPGSSVSFSWTDVGADSYNVAIGSTAGGSDYYDQDQGTNTTVTVSGLPTDGSTVYVELGTLSGGMWHVNSYQFTAATGSTLYFSTLSNSTIPSVASPFDDADIYRWDGSSFDREVDAQDELGLSFSAKGDGYDNSTSEGLCLSFDSASTTVPGLSSAVDYTDVVCQANGSWSVFFDGSAQGLGTTSAYNLDAISIVNGVLYFSTKGSSSMTIPGVAAPYHTADIYSWDNGTFTRVFDANAAGLASHANMDGLSFIDNNTFYASFSRNDNYGGTSLPGGVVALDEDVVKYDQGSWTLYFEGVAEGFDASNDGQDIDALDVQ